MSSKFVQEGKFMVVTLSGTVAVNAVDVIGTGKIGVAQKAGVSGDVINYAVEGVYKLPKVSGAVITQGQKVLFDVSAASGAGEVDDDQATPAAGDFLCGTAWESAGAGVLEIAVKINDVPSPTVT
jgi:predicted RecA/RadA family phage recombinase